MSLLANTFPGTWQKSRSAYNYYLPGSIFLSCNLTLSLEITKKLQEASLSLGQFSSLIEHIPNPLMFIQAYTAKEATLSSRIEGTQTQIEDAFKTIEQIMPERRDDWEEVNAYIKAMKQAIKKLEKLPLSMRLLQNTHKTLLSNTRGQHKQPGKLRQSQNWIGGSRPDNAHFVPPSHEHIPELLSDLEKFIHQNALPELINAALIHYQFETIHPFLDGNGRLGRMLISLYLLDKKILRYPILYVSTFLEQHRQTYYLMLDRAREDENGLLQWISFFLDAVHHSAEDAISVTQKLLEYEKSLRYQSIPKLGRRAKNGAALLDYLYKRPIIDAKQVQQELGFSPQISQAILNDFCTMKILKEMTGFKRNRIFMFERYIWLLNGGEDG